MHVHCATKHFCLLRKCIHLSAKKSGQPGIYSRKIDRIKLFDFAQLLKYSNPSGTADINRTELISETVTFIFMFSRMINLFPYFLKGQVLHDDRVWSAYHRDKGHHSKSISPFEFFPSGIRLLTSRPRPNGHFGGIVSVSNYF